MVEQISNKNLDKAFLLLSQKLAGEGASHVNLVICGGSALIISGIVNKEATKDVDVLAFLEKNKDGKNIVKSKPLPEFLLDSARRVADELGLDENWLNPGPADLLDLGLPDGLIERLQSKEYGNSLTVYYIGRFDQICFKLYAAADLGPGRHMDDLLSLSPTEEEIESAARWAITHDPSPGFRSVLKQMLKVLKYESVAERI